MLGIRPSSIDSWFIKILVLLHSDFKFVSGCLFQILIFKQKIVFFAHLYVQSIFLVQTLQCKIRKRKKIAQENLKKLPSKVAYFSLIEEN